MPLRPVAGPSSRKIGRAVGGFGTKMAPAQNIFELENRVDELFEVIYPPAAKGKAHPSGRAHKPMLQSALAALVPDDGTGRRLQQQREYVKVDFQDFIDYATCDLPKDA